MRASANRTQDNESRAVANNVSCKREERQAVHLVDNSSHTKSIAQFQAMADKSSYNAQLRKFQEMADKSMNPHQVQLRKFREMIDNSPQRKKIVLPGVTQKKGPLDEDELQFKSKEAVQKKGPLDEDELQFKKDETVQCKGPLDEEELQFKAEEPVQQQENKTGLPDGLKAGVENLSGMAMDDVRVHYNSGKPAQLNAFAYTQGTEIHVAPGQEKHLPHEAWHVVQQKQGRVQPTMQMAGGVAVNDDKGLEREADASAQRIQAKDLNRQMPELSNEISSRVLQGVFEQIGNAARIPNTDYIASLHAKKCEIHLCSHSKEIKVKNSENNGYHTFLLFANFNSEELAEYIKNKYTTILSYSTTISIWLHGCYTDRIAGALKQRLIESGLSGKNIKVYGTIGLSGTEIKQGDYFLVVPRGLEKDWEQIEDKANSKDGVTEHDLNKFMSKVYKGLNSGGYREF